MARDSDLLVFSTDRTLRDVCPRCGKQPCTCATAGEPKPAGTLLRMRLDRKGRGGKAVTVIYELPPYLDYFQRLVKTLKTHCGTGGALKDGAMELQGDQRDKVQAYLEKLGYTVRRSGG